MKIPRRRSPTRELVTPDLGGSFALKEARPSHWPFAWHCHPEIELTLIERGRGLRHVGDSVQEFAEGDLCLLGPDLPHTWSSQPTPGRAQHSLVVQFSEQLAAGLPESRALGDLLGRARRGLVFAGTTRRSAAERLRRLAATRSPLDRLGQLLSLLALLAASDEAQPLALTATSAPRRADARVAASLALVHQRAALGREQATAAAAVGMSPAAFSRFVRRHLGKTYVAYRAELRIGEACRALAETARPVLAIALDAGFHNLSTFNRQFRQLKGIAPNAYRRIAAGG